MTQTALPPPVLQRPAPGRLEVDALHRALRERVDGEVGFDAGTRAAYSVCRERSGKAVDNIAGLEVLLYDGTRFWCGETSEAQYRAIERHGG